MKEEEEADKREKREGGRVVQRGGPVGCGGTFREGRSVLITSLTFV